MARNLSAAPPPTKENIHSLFDDLSDYEPSIAASVARIHELEDEKRYEALRIIWAYDPDNESEFRYVIEAFVLFIGEKSRAGRLLLAPPMTMYRWLKGIHVPRAFVRVGLKARMIEVVGSMDATVPPSLGSAEVTAKPQSASGRRKYG